MIFWTLGLNIDKAIIENKPLNLMSDYNLNYFCKKEKQQLETVLRPSNLYPINFDNPSRFMSNDKTLINFLITDKYLETLLVAIFDSLISCDHLAQLKL